MRTLPPASTNVVALSPTCPTTAARVARLVAPPDAPGSDLAQHWDARGGRPRDSLAVASSESSTVRARERATLAERAAWLGPLASMLAVASGAALGTLSEPVRVPALVTFVVAVALASWARRVLGSAPADRWA